MGFFWGNIGGNVYSGLSHKIEALKFRSVVILRFEKCETKRHTHTSVCYIFLKNTISQITENTCQFLNVQEAQLSQRDRAVFLVIECLPLPLKVTQGY